MFHLIKWERKEIGNKTYITNELRWIEVQYKGIQKEWTYFLHPHIDDTNKTIAYIAFDRADQKALFEKVVKISGIWHKTALQIATLDLEELQEIIQQIQIDKLTSFKGIGPKIAKRLIVELKNDLTKDDAEYLSQDKKITNQIIKQLQALWYEKIHIGNTIEKYGKPITSVNQKTVIKRLIKQL